MPYKPVLFTLSFLLAFATGLYTQIGRFAPAFSGRRPKIYTVIFSLLSALLSIGIVFLERENTLLLTVYLSVLFLLIGIVHYKMNHDRYFNYGVENYKVLTGEYFFTTTILFYTLLLSILGIYYLISKEFLFFPVLVCSLFFYFPLLLMNVFDAAENIPLPIYKTWSFPTIPPDVPGFRLNEKLMVTHYEIPKTQGEQLTYFRAKAFDDFSLGDNYYFFIDDYHADTGGETPIKTHNEDDIPYEWWFFKKKKWYKRYNILDPELTMLENGVKENEVIVCIRK